MGQNIREDDGVPHTCEDKLGRILMGITTFRWEQDDKSFVIVLRTLKKPF